MQDYGQTCGDRPGDVAYERGIDSALLQALEREGAKGIIADAGLEYLDQRYFYASLLQGAHIGLGSTAVGDHFVE